MQGILLRKVPLNCWKVMDFWLGRGSELGKQFITDYLIEFKILVDEFFIQTIFIANKYPAKDIDAQQDKLYLSS